MMTSSRKWTAGAVAVAVLLTLASWFLLIAPQRSEASDLRDQTAAQVNTNDQIRLKTQQLQAEFASLPERQAQLAEIKQQLPDGPGLPTLVRDLSSYAKSAGVSLQSVAPGVPTAVGAATGAGVTTPGATPAPSASGVTLQAIPTTVTATGTYAELTLYLQKLQSSMRRAFLIQNIQLAPAPEDKSVGTPDLLMTIQGEIFVMTTPSAPAATAAPTTSTAN